MVIYLRGEVRVLTVITIVGLKCHDAREWRRWWVEKGGWGGGVGGWSYI